MILKTSSLRREYSATGGAPRVWEPGHLPFGRLGVWAFGRLGVDARSSNQLNDHLTVPPARVELDQDDLLPRPDTRATALEWNRNRRAEHRGAHVARSVVITPLQMVLIVAVSRRELLPHPIQIRDCAGLELDRRDTSRRPDDSHGDEAVCKGGLGHDQCDQAGQIVYVALPFRRDSMPGRLHHSVIIARSLA